MPEPAATGDDVQWGNPLTRTRAINALNDPAGPLAFVDAMARDLLKNFFHHRNTRTGEITPGCARLAFELPFKERAIFYTLGRLDTGPSCQRGGEIIQGHGLIWRDPRWRRFGGQTSNSYGLTCKLLELIGLVLPHDPETCTQCLKERAVLAARRARASRRRGSPRRSVAATLPLPGMPMEPAVRAEAAPPMEPAVRAEAAPPIEPAPMAPDPDFEVFAAVFAAERSAKYGNQRGGTVRAEKRAAIGAMVLDLTAEASAWALGRGLELDRGAVREDLCRRMVRTWLTWTGTADYLITRPDPHPMGLIAGDLAGLGAEALTAWKRSQPRPKRIARVEPVETSPAEAWPELDTSEPEAGELAAMRAELGVPPPPPAPPPAEWFALMAKLGPSKPVPPPAPLPTQEELLRAKQAEIRERALALLSSPEGEAPAPRLRTRLGLRSRPVSDGSESTPGSESGSESGSKGTKIRLRRPTQAWPHKRRVPEPAESAAPTNSDDGSGEQGDGDP